MPRVLCALLLLFCSSAWAFGEHPLAWAGQAGGGCAALSPLDGGRSALYLEEDSTLHWVDLDVTSPPTSIASTAIADIAATHIAVGTAGSDVVLVAGTSTAPGIPGAVVVVAARLDRAASSIMLYPEPVVLAAGPVVALQAVGGYLRVLRNTATSDEVDEYRLGDVLAAAAGSGAASRVVQDLVRSGAHKMLYSEQLEAYVLLSKTQLSVRPASGGGIFVNLGRHVGVDIAWGREAGRDIVVLAESGVLVLIRVAQGAGRIVIEQTVAPVSLGFTSTASAAGLDFYAPWAVVALADGTVGRFDTTGAQNRTTIEVLPADVVEGWGVAVQSVPPTVGGVIAREGMQNPNEPTAVAALCLSQTSVAITPRGGINAYIELTPTQAPPSPMPPTPAPLVLVPPATPSPPPATQLPASQAPVTQSPSTQAPPTTAPLTPVPTTPTPTGALRVPTPRPRPSSKPPPTALPSTAVPRTDQPRSGVVDPTAVPRKAPTAQPALTRVPETTDVPGDTTGNMTTAEAYTYTTMVRHERELAVAARIAATLSLATGHPIGMWFQRSALAVRSCSAPSSTSEPFSSLSMWVSDIDGSSFGAAIIQLFATLIAVGVALGAYGFMLRVRPTNFGCLDSVLCPGVRLADAAGAVRFPYVPLLVFVTLYQGLSYSAVRLLVAASDVSDVLVGTFALVLCVCVPLRVYFHTVQSVPRDASYRLDPNGPKGSLGLLLWGAGEWVNSCPTRQFTHRYNHFVTAYRQDVAARCVLVYAALSLAVSVLEAVPVSDPMGCAAVKLTTAGLLFVLCAGTVRFRPYVRPFVNHLEVLVIVATGTAAFAMGLGYLRNDDPMTGSFGVAYITQLIALVLLCVRLVLELVVYIYLSHVVRRRARLQDAMYLRTRVASHSQDDGDGTVSLIDWTGAHDDMSELNGIEGDVDLFSRAKRHVDVSAGSLRSPRRPHGTRDDLVCSSVGKDSYHSPNTQAQPGLLLGTSRTSECASMHDGDPASPMSLHMHAVTPEGSSLEVTTPPAAGGRWHHGESNSSIAGFVSQPSGLSMTSPHGRPRVQNDSILPHRRPRFMTGSQPPGGAVRGPITQQAAGHIADQPPAGSPRMRTPGIVSFPTADTLRATSPEDIDVDVFAATRTMSFNNNRSFDSPDAGVATHAGTDAPVEKRVVRAVSGTSPASPTGSSLAMSQLRRSPIAKARQVQHDECASQATLRAQVGGRPIMRQPLQRQAGMGSGLLQTSVSKMPSLVAGGSSLRDTLAAPPPRGVDSPTSDVRSDGGDEEAASPRVMTPATRGLRFAGGDGVSIAGSPRSASASRDPALTASPPSRGRTSATIASGGPAKVVRSPLTRGATTNVEGILSPTLQPADDADVLVPTALALGTAGGMPNASVRTLVPGVAQGDLSRTASLLRVHGSPLSSRRNTGIERRIENGSPTMSSFRLTVPTGPLVAAQGRRSSVSRHVMASPQSSPRQLLLAQKVLVPSQPIGVAAVSSDSRAQAL